MSIERTGPESFARPGRWTEQERARLLTLKTLRLPIHLELGLHPSEHACAACRAVRDLRAESEKLEIPLVWVEVASVPPGAEGVAAPPPWLRVLPPGSESGPVRFLGPPRGDLLASLLGVVQDVATTPLSPPLGKGWKELAERVQRRRHHFRVFAAARNADAPPVVRALARLVHLRPDRFALDVYDVETFPKEARRRGVRHLPCVTIDDFAHFYGPPDEGELLEAIEHVMPSGVLPYAGVKGESPFGGMP